ncbi:hypothetical protein DER46DRAFT_611520 [Fusarium sp. MPI-SDFR-AT-0072]|nr:hypothetical protein DER46DRAFT_611520 [Fusarium sp. MPI-SDFR-AT-0072]
MKSQVAHASRLVPPLKSSAKWTKTAGLAVPRERVDKMPQALPSHPPRNPLRAQRLRAQLQRSTPSVLHALTGLKFSATPLTTVWYLTEHHKTSPNAFRSVSKMMIARALPVDKTVVLVSSLWLILMMSRHLRKGGDTMLSRELAGCKWIKCRRWNEPSSQ